MHLPCVSYALQLPSLRVLSILCRTVWKQVETRGTPLRQSLQLGKSNSGISKAFTAPSRIAATIQPLETSVLGGSQIVGDGRGEDG